MPNDHPATMQPTRLLDFECVPLENNVLQLLVTQSVGPRIISLRFDGGDNMLAVLPDFVTQLPDGKQFHFYGGHRLWHAPENMPRTYALDDGRVEIVPTPSGLLVTQPVEVETGIEKSIRISLVEDKAQVILHHTLTNHSQWPVECAPWAITQFRIGGMAILPQSREETDILPNRSLAFWPYADLASPHIRWGNRYLLIHAKMQNPFKVGFPNPRGWLAYWLDGTLFVKRADYDPRAPYYDFGSSSECYCNGRFLELETLAPTGILEPGESATHVETWSLYHQEKFPDHENAVQSMVEELGLE